MKPARKYIHADICVLHTHPQDENSPRRIWSPIRVQIRPDHERRWIYIHARSSAPYRPVSRDESYVYLRNDVEKFPETIALALKDAERLGLMIPDGETKNGNMGN